MTCRIYYIRSRTNHRTDDLGFLEYIGSTTKDDWDDIRRDWLRKGKHYNSPLQNAWNKYGERGIQRTHEIVASCECGHLYNWSQYTCRQSRSLSCPDCGRPLPPKGKLE